MDEDRNEVIRQAERELRRDGVLAVDTYIALNLLGIDPASIERESQ